MNKELVANANFSEAQQHYSVQRAIQQTLLYLQKDINQLYMAAQH